MLDEAYVEYARLSGCESGLAWLQEFPNLVLVRTFSKAYGLAGVRVGYSVSHPEVADALNRIRPAFNVSNVAQAGAMAALADQTHVERAARLVVAERERVAAALRAMNLPVDTIGRQLSAGRGGQRAARLRAVAARWRDRASGRWLRSAASPAHFHRPS